MLGEKWRRYRDETPTAKKLALLLGPCLAILGALALQGLAMPARVTAATVILMAIWWVTEPIPLWATALLPLLAFPLAGASSLSDVLLEYFDPVNFLFLGGMWIAAAVEDWGLHRRMALGIVAALGSSPRRIVLGFMLGTAFISLWISNTASAVLMFPIGLAALAKFQEQAGSGTLLARRFGLALMLGIAYAASIGGIGTKIGTGTNLVFVKQSALLLGKEVSFVSWLALGIPIILLVLPLAWLYLVRIVAPLPAEAPPGAADAIFTERRALGPIRRGEALALAAFLGAAFLWTFRADIDLGFVTIPGVWQILPLSWPDVLGRPVEALPRPLSELLGPRGVESVIALGVSGLLFLLPAGGGRTVLSLNRAARIQWGILALLGGGFAMAFGIKQSGLSEVLAGALENAPSLPPFPSLLLVCLATVFLSEVASNTATASILLPILALGAEHLGLEATTLMFGATLSASFGLMLPAGTPPNAIAYASGYVRPWEMMKSGFAVDVCGTTLVAAVCYFLGPWILG